VTAQSKTKRSAGPGRLSAEDAANLPDRLLDAAEALFSEHGFGATSMERIAKKAGASTKTLYARYTDKARMLEAVVRRVIDRTIAGHWARTSEDPRHIDPHLFLTTLGRDVARTLNGPAAGLNRLAFAEARHYPVLADLYRLALAHGSGLLRDVFTQWHEDGVLPILPDAERAGILCLSILLDQVRIRSALGIPMTPHEVEAHVSYGAEIFLRGCGYEVKK